MRLIQHKREAYWFYRFLSLGYDRWVNPLFWTPAMRAEALSEARLEGDLMVLDDLMVDAFGAEVVHELRALEEGRDLPLIIYFCHYGEHDRDQLAQDWKDAGTIAQFAKPFYPWDLLEEVAGHVAEFVKQRIDKKQFAASAPQPE